MSATWTCRQWRLGGERTTLGPVTFDSTLHGGAGQNFHATGPDRYRFRARAGLEPYSWRFCFRIESPGDGREITIEAADFNHFGQEIWQEQATVLSRDGAEWTDLGVENIRLIPWTPTGKAEDDASLNDGAHPPYGVEYRVRLDSPVLWFASPTPYTLQHSQAHQRSLAARCDFFTVEEIGRPHYFSAHGFPILMTKAARRGAERDKIRVLVVAGEHPAEVAGMYACEGLMEEILRTLDLLSDFSFWIVPVVNVDGVALGRTYHNVDPKDPIAPGVNLARDWPARREPETQAVWRAIEEVRPHCVLSLHNGRHRQEFELFAPPGLHLSKIMKHLRERLPVPLARWNPAPDGSLAPEVMKAGRAEIGLCFETLLLRKMPGCQRFSESYRRTGVCVLRGLAEGLRDAYGRPQMLALREALGTGPVRLRATDFAAKLPSFYYDNNFENPHEHPIHNFEVNGLPLLAGHYDVRLKMRAGFDHLTIVKGDATREAARASAGWILLPSMNVPARKLAFEFEHPSGDLPFEEVLIAPEGTPLEVAEAPAEPFARYVRNTRVREKPHLTNWGPFYSRLMSQGFGAADLQGMFDELVDWIAGRQVRGQDDRHYGAIWSEEDKYDARDAAAAAACFARRYSATTDSRWRDRALAAREYVYRNQMREPGNTARHGGFVHMVQGIWGVRFVRLEPPYPGIDGVDTCVIIHQLCQAVDAGLPAAERDREVLREAAQWVANNEPLPGMFLHHEGATHDCQNSNALGLSALVRAYHTLAQAGESPPADWLAAAERGLRHYMEGQEAIGVWPYIFAAVGQRGQAYHFGNIPDHGIGLVHLTSVCDKPPVSDFPGVKEMLKRAARWYLCVCRLDDDTIDLEYDQRPSLGDDICFSGFTWCRFTAAATLLRVARITGEVEPWRHLALRLMEHVGRKLWQRSNPNRAPVAAHARPEAKLATWCQAAEWDASMLARMIEDLDALRLAGT